MYTWTLPAPGLWHFEWHMQKCIWRYAGKWLLSPLAIYCRRPRGYFKDANVTDFRITDGLLEQLCMTGVSWLKTLMRGAKENTIESLMAKVHNNKPLFEFMWVIRMLVVPYCHMRWLVRTGEHAEILKQMGYWFHLFAGCNKVRFPFFFKFNQERNTQLWKWNR